MEDKKHITEKVFAIETKENFLEFMQWLMVDFKERPGEWENNDLASYLDAIASWTEDMDGFFINFNLPVPENVDWKTFAMILLAAKGYE